MSTSNYDGPRSGDYARYVDDLLRASPLYRGSVQSLLASGRRDFTDAAATPGEQPTSALARLRAQAEAAVEKAQKEVQAAAKQAASGDKAPRKPRRPRMELEAEQAARREALRLAANKKSEAKPWWRITPARIVFLLILIGISFAVPGLGAMLLLFTLINAVRSGVQSARKP